ncbi:MAG: helix-turn-helix domain-containing protein, partial [Bifidobacteriaceae bacterium]|nr:helix-turn-helix domain-containing protein [Bifidobacteriaceae bacterium]
VRLPPGGLMSGIALRATRRRAGLTQTEAAAIVGLEPVAYAAAEAGSPILDSEAYGQAFYALAILPEAQPTDPADPGSTAVSVPGRHPRADPASPAGEPDRPGTNPAEQGPARTRLIKPGSRAPSDASDPARRSPTRPIPTHAKTNPPHPEPNPPRPNPAPGRTPRQAQRNQPPPPLPPTAPAATSRRTPSSAFLYPTDVPHTSCKRATDPPGLGL